MKGCVWYKGWEDREEMRGVRCDEEQFHNGVRTLRFEVAPHMWGDVWRRHDVWLLDMVGKKYLCKLSVLPSFNAPHTHKANPTTSQVQMVIWNEAKMQPRTHTPCRVVIPHPVNDDTYRSALPQRSMYNAQVVHIRMTSCSIDTHRHSTRVRYIFTPSIYTSHHHVCVGPVWIWPTQCATTVDSRISHHIWSTEAHAQ